MTERQMLEYLKTQINTQKTQHSKEEQEKKKLHKQQWSTFWRRNINLYISHKLGIPTYSFQHISYYLMQDSNMYEEIATRGTSKSFKMAVYGIAECMVRPNSKVVITADTLDQAKRLVEEKMKGELFINQSLSPVLCYLYKNKLIEIKDKDTYVQVVFNFNNSKMTIVGCQDSVRGLRANILMFEECRLMSKSKIDAIFENMLQPRTAEYLNNVSREEKLKLQEPTKSIYITSNRVKSEWFFKLFQKLFIQYFNNPKAKTNVFGCDIYIALKYGLKQKQWFLNAQKTMNELDFRMEVLNEALGESEDAYFTSDLMSKTQTLKQSFRPPKPHEWKVVADKNRQKRPDEYRLLFIDFAFANTTSTGRANDNTVIGCFSFYPKGDGWVRNVEYIETHAGGESFATHKRIRELYWFYEADYIVMDNQNGGERDYNELGTVYEHPEISSRIWNSHGFTVSKEIDLHAVPKAKVEELAKRTIDPQAIPCIIPIKGNEGLNSEMWKELSATIKANELRLLIDDLQIQQTKEYIKQTDEKEKALMRLPYLQTFYLIREAVNLKATYKGGVVKLSEPPSGYKDRIVALSYGNYIASKIINKCQRNKADGNNIDWDNFQLVF